MDKLLHSATILLRIELFIGLCGLMLFLGYLGLASDRSTNTHLPIASPTIHNID